MASKSLIIDTKENQLKIKDDFQSLFRETFKRSMSDEKWRHFYLNMPYGQTISFVYYADNKMIAHGGLIPQRLLAKDGSIIEYFLQTGVMVKKEYQTLVLFKYLMDSISAYINDRDSFVVSFPNDQAYLPFVKMLRWRMVREYSIGQYELKAGYHTEHTKRDKDDFQYEIYKDEAFINWRRELNGFKVLEGECFSLIYKEYEGSLEILDISTKDNGIVVPVGDIMREFEYQKANIPECFSHYISFNDLIFSKNVSVPQRMCFYPPEYEKCSYEEIKPSLLLSDVF